MKEVRSIVESASHEERHGLARSLGGEPHPEAIVASLLEAARERVGSAAHHAEEAYHHIVRDVSTRLGIGVEGELGVPELEVKVAQKVVSAKWEKMAPHHREHANAKLRETARQLDHNGAALGTAPTVTMLTTAHLPALGVHLLAATALDLRRLELPPGDDDDRGVVAQQPGGATPAAGEKDEGIHDDPLLDTVLQLTSLRARQRFHEERAYYHWLHRGKPVGDDWNDWFATDR